MKILAIIPRPSLQLTKRKEVDRHQENIATILACSNATPIRCRGRIGYACSFCEQEFIEPADLKHHTLTSHDEAKPTFMKGHPLASFVVKLDITNLTCNICKNPYHSLPEFTSHLQAHGKTFHTTIRNHVVPFQFDSEPLKCAICRNKFNNFKVLVEHMNKHYTNYVCKVCGSGFVNKRTLQTHGYRHIKGEFKCTRCVKVFDTKVKMKEHERAVHVHRNIRSKCGYCGDMFSDYWKKQEHEVREHGAKAATLVCQACEKTFRSQRALSVHIKLFHLLEGRGRKTEGQ